MQDKDFPLIFNTQGLRGCGNKRDRAVPSTQQRLQELFLVKKEFFFFLPGILDRETLQSQQLSQLIPSTVNHVLLPLVVELPPHDVLAQEMHHLWGTGHCLSHQNPGKFPWIYNILLPCVVGGESQGIFGTFSQGRAVF